MSRSIAQKMGIALALIALCSQALNAQLASRKLEATDSYNLKQPIIFSDDFRGDLQKWEISIDALYLPEQRPLSSPLVKIVPADDGIPGKTAVRFEVPGLPGTFRSELALPAEEGLHDRWYAERVMVPTVPTDEAGYIVMQWHAVMGEAALTSRNFPNLAIWIDGDEWTLRRAFGTPLNIKRDAKCLPVRAEAGKWTDWVIHAKWSKGPDGEIQVWQNGTLVWDIKGPNSYSELAKDYTPYLKTGIYRSSRKETKTSEDPTVVYVGDVKIGREDATYKMVAPSH
jgi:hypothetical protein